MNQPEFLKTTKMNFAKNFFQRSFNGKVTENLQPVGYKGTSSRGALCFTHVIPNVEEYHQNKKIYVTNLAKNLVKEINETFEKRTVQFKPQNFLVPKIPLVETMTEEPLSIFFQNRHVLISLILFTT